MRDRAPSMVRRVSPSSLSIIVPLFDEEQGVPALAARLRAFVAAEAVPRAVDLVLVDDGSGDATHARLEEHFRGTGAAILRHPHNRGLTAALATGLASARGDLVAWLDSDLTYDPSVLLPLAAAIDAGDADLALASCYHPLGGVEGVPRWRLWLSRLASRGYRLTTGAPLHTFTCMVRVYRRAVLEACVPARGGFLGVTEVLLAAIRRGHRVVEVPAVLRRRRAGQSKMRLLRVGFGHLRLMLARNV